MPNLSDPITCSFSDRRGRACVVCHSGAGRLGTLKYNSFRWRSIRMFNRLPDLPLFSQNRLACMRFGKSPCSILVYIVIHQQSNQHYI